VHFQQFFSSVYAEKQQVSDIEKNNSNAIGKNRWRMNTMTIRKQRSVYRYIQRNNSKMRKTTATQLVRIDGE